MWKSAEQVQKWKETCNEASKEATEAIWREARQFVELQIQGSDEPTYSTLVAAYVQARSTLLSMEQMTTMFEFISQSIDDVANK